MNGGMEERKSGRVGEWGRAARPRLPRLSHSPILPFSHSPTRRWGWMRSALLYLVLMVGAVPLLIPFAWMVSSSLKTRELAGEYPPRWLPESERAYLAVNGRREEVLLLTETGDGRAKVRRADGAVEFVPEG